MDKLGGQPWMWFRKMKNRHLSQILRYMYKVCMNFVLRFLQRKIRSLLPKFQDFEVSPVLTLFSAEVLVGSSPTFWDITYTEKTRYNT